MRDIIKNIFLPEAIGTNYLFAKTIVALMINKTHVTATKVVLQGHAKTVQAVVEEKIEIMPAEESDHNASLARTLNLVFEKIGSYDELHLVVPSAMVIFKELKLPFLSYEKIKMVIGFEIEPLLPFALKDAVVDFVVTKQNIENKSSELLAIAIQKSHINEYVSLLALVNKTIDIVTVDTIALYSLYEAIPGYKIIEGGTALVDVGLYNTRITLMINSQLKIVRTLPKGIIAITKKAATELNTTPQDVMEKMIRFGLDQSESSEYAQKIEQAAATVWDDIIFTFTSFTAQFLQRSPMAKVIFLGEGSLMRGFVESFAKKSLLPCELFNVAHLQEIPLLSYSTDVDINRVNIVVLSAALPSLLTQKFNLLYPDVIVPNNMLLVKQLVVVMLLTLGLCASLITHYSIQTSLLKAEIRSSEHEVLSALKEKFSNLEDIKKMTDAIDEAGDEVEKQKETWFAFSNQSRSSFLQYLLELTSRVDSKSTGLEVEQISIAEKELLLKARVKDYDALKVLERELGQSKLFSYVEPQENLQFTMKIMLAQNIEE